MSHHVIFVSCWLLAVGRGSGLTGIASPDHESTIPVPHSPRPPPQVTSTTSPLLTHVKNFSLRNFTTPQPMVEKQQNGKISPLSFSTTTISTTQFTPILLPSSIFTTVVNTSKTTLQTPSILPSFSSPDISSATMSTTQFVEHTVTLTKESVREVPQSSQREWFVRRKHKGPYFAGRVQKLAATLRGTGMPLDVGRKIYHKTNYSQTMSKVKDFSSLNMTLSSVINPLKTQEKIKLSKTARGPPIPFYAKAQNNTKRITTVDRTRKRPIVMGIPASSTVLLAYRSTSTPAPTVETYNPPDSDEYYSSYGEYPDLPIIGYNGSGYSEAALLPDPDSGLAVDEIAEAEAEVVLPDDSLADTDLHDHDLIDSVMYIYFGSSERDERGAGRQVLIVGAVISLVAQFLTLVSVLRRLRTRPDESASLILLNAELALTAGNLVFMLGVQATGSKRRCELVAVSLHYLHLVTCGWFLVNSMFSYHSVCQQSETRRRLRPWWLAAWCGPVLIVLACVVFNRRGYETRAFCWMSVARGMLYSFMVPIASLIFINTCFAVLGLRKLSLSAKTEDSDRKSMRISATMLPVFAVVWFLGVVALENSASLIFPLLFVASSGFLNWFVLACWLPADLSLWRESDEDFDDDDDDLYEEVLKAHTDSQPLLEEPQVYVCGRRDMCELQMDPICTISS